MLLHLFPRDQEYSLPTDTASDSGDNKNKTTQIIIGVVVGGVAAIAITAGILFFLIKKRRWDRIRRYEERLLDYQLATGQGKSRSATPDDHYLNMMAPRPSSTFSYPVTTPMVARSRATSAPEAPPPAYQSIHPRYDPSQYQGVRASSSTASSSANPNTRSSRGLSFIKPIVDPFHSRRSESLSAPLPSAIRPQSHFWYQQQPQPESSLGRPSGEWPIPGNVGLGLDPESLPASATAGEPSSSRPSVEGSRGPRRPKPVLSKIITNL